MDHCERLEVFLSKTFAEFSEKFKEFDKFKETVAGFSSDEVSVKKMLDSVFTCWEEINGIMERFKSDLNKRNIIKESLVVPKPRFLQSGSGTRDSGIDTVSSSGSPYVSANRLSTSDDDNYTPDNRVSFNLKSTNTSYSDFTENILDEETEDGQVGEISTVYIHIMPSDETTDTSTLREKIRDLSRSTLKSDNFELHVVPSGSFIGITSRQSSVSSGGLNSIRTSRQTSTSSEAFNHTRNRLPSSNDSLSAALLTLTHKIPEEHTDSSDDQRIVSSSDSDISVMRHSVSLATRRQCVTIETQTDFENYRGAISAETQTE